MPRVARRRMRILWDVVAILGPVGDEVVDDDVTDAISAVERGKVGAVLSDFGLGEAFCGSGADALVSPRTSPIARPTTLLGFFWLLGLLRSLGKSTALCSVTRVASAGVPGRKAAAK